MISLAALTALPFTFTVKEIVGVDSVDAISPGLVALVTVPKPHHPSVPAVWSSGHLSLIEKSEARYLDPVTGHFSYCEVQDEDGFEGRGVLDDGTVVGCYIHRVKVSDEDSTPQLAIWRQGVFTIINGKGMLNTVGKDGVAYGRLDRGSKTELYMIDTKTFVGKSVAVLPDAGAYPRVMADGSIHVSAGSEYQPETWVYQEGSLSLLRKNEGRTSALRLPQGRLNVARKEWTLTATSESHFESKLLIRSGNQSAEFKPSLPDSPESVGVSCIGPNGSVVFMANWSKPFHNRFFLATPVLE